VDFAKKRITVHGLHETVIGTGLDGLLDVPSPVLGGLHDDAHGAVPIEWADPL